MTHPELNELVVLARRDRPTPGVLAAVARNLRVPFVAVPIAGIVTPSSAFGSVASKVGLTRLALLGWGAGSTVAVSGVAIAIALHQPTEPPRAPPAVAALRAVSNEAPEKAVEPAVAPEITAPPSSAPRVVKDAPAATWDEPQLIEKARLALASDPRRALLLTQEHQRRFPAGALGVERDVIALEALARSGQIAAARRRALLFEAKYPKSIHLPRVRALLARLDTN